MSRNYQEMTAEALADFFGTVSRQRIQQILKRFQTSQDEETVRKIKAAKKILKQRKYMLKRGVTAAEYKKSSSLWETLRNRVGRHPSYLDCTVAWASEEEFREWAVKQVGFMTPSYELDKDLLIKGNRIYGPDTCVFVPQEVNVLLSGCYKSRRRGKYPLGVCFNRGSGTFLAQMSSRQEKGLDKYLGSFPTVEEAFACYKVAKEARIKALAEKWKDHIDPRAYQAMMERTVEWND